MKYEKELNNHPRKPRQNNQCYFTIKELESGKEYVDSVYARSKSHNTKVEKEENYWTFFANPKFWYIDDFLNSEKVNEELYYSIRASDKDKMKIGDIGVIRVGVDNRTKTQLNGKNKLQPGIYAIIEIKSIPQFTSDNDDEFYSNKEDSKKEKWRIKIKVIKNLLNKPIIFKENNNHILNKDKYLIKGMQAATMPLLKETFYEIVNLSASSSELYNYEEVIDEDNYRFADSTTGIEALNKIYEKVDIKKKERIVQVVERGSIATEFKKYIGGKCQICERMRLNPYSFRKKNGDYYLEVHHVIPVNDTENSKLSVDNLISVCANHHRQIHYGDVELISNNDDYIEYKIDGKLIKIEKVKISSNDKL